MRRNSTVPRLIQYALTLAWVDTQGQRDKFNTYRMCMIIDEECLQTLLGTSVETLEQDTNNERYKTVR
jgi:hypothetical protein